MLKSFILRLVRVIVPQLPAIYVLLNIDPNAPANTQLAGILIMAGALLTALDKLFRDLGWYLGPKVVK